MARVNSQILFLTTSPRTPEKMIPEIDLLVKCYQGEKWDSKSQKGFMDILREEQFFYGKAEKDPAFSARDRINRAPKALGFVSLSPVISLTPAGNSLLMSKRKEEVFLRQMLKFQIPSVYHKPTEKATYFWVKPYLEMIRLVRVMGTLSFDELQIFGMQLTDWRNFEEIVEKIKSFRVAKSKISKNYKMFKLEYIQQELKRIYAERISKGDTKTRESKDVSLIKFLKTQSSNMRDYADACFRYLKATGLMNISHEGKSLSVIKERINEVDYILQNVERDPCFVDDECKYVEYLGNPSLPCLLTDDKDLLLKQIKSEFNEVEIGIGLNASELKDLLFDLIENRKQESINKQIKEIKDYRLYDDIQKVYAQIENNELFDAPLMLEWNTWRAMTMLNGGNIKANLKFDDLGKPLSTAQGNMPDIVCDYGEFLLSVEVTMSSGQKQYDMEGEPVSRHLGKMKKESSKPCYCLFIAPTINPACVAHFYTLHNLSVSYYGGKSIIIPLPLNIFTKMLADSYNVDYIPSSENVRMLFEYSKELVKTCGNELEWYEAIKNKALNWLN